MVAEREGESPRSREVMRAKFRMVFWLLLFFIVTLLWASLTFPFLGYASSAQNVLHGIAVASPFWITVIAALLTLRRRMRG
jgi:hypothetical protein